MFIYLSFFLLSMSFITLSEIVKSSVARKLFLLLFLFLMFSFSAFRGDVGQDTYSYGTHFLRFNDFFSWLQQDKLIEPFIYIVMALVKVVYNSYTLFLIVISLIQTFLFWYCLRGIRHKILFVFFYLTIYYLDYHFNILRASLSVLFMLCAIYDFDRGNKRFFWIFVFLSVASHLSSILLILMLFLTGRISFRLQSKYTLMVVSLVVFVFFMFYELFFFKVNAYELSVIGDVSIRGRGAVLIAIFMLAIFLIKNMPKDVRISSGMFSLFYLVSFVFPNIGYRVFYMQLLVLIYFLLSSNIFNLLGGRVKSYSLPVLILALWFSYGGVKSVLNEYEVRKDSGKGMIEFNYIPYSWFSESRYR